MSRDFWLGVAAIPALAVVVAVVWLGPYVASGLVERWRPSWRFSGPQWRTRDPAEIFRRVNVRGRHLATYRRLVAIGPWTIYLGRYKPGHVEEKP